MADLKIYKSLTQGVSDEKFKSEFGRGTVSFVSWERLRPYIEHSVGKKIDERIAGIKIDESGVTVRFEKSK